MPNEQPDIVMRSAAVLACKYIILTVCNTLSLGLATITKLLATESGPFARHPNSLAITIESLVDQIGLIVYGKSHIHSVLHGDEEDELLVSTIDAILQQIKVQLATPLRSLIGLPIAESEIRPKVRALSAIAANLHDQVRVLLVESETRFGSANSVHAKTFGDSGLVWEAPTTEEWTVVSVDKVAYSSGALALESLENPRVLMEHNRAIVEHFETAIGNAGGKVSDVLVHESGDGALLYFKDPSIAVRAGLEIHRLARKNSLRLPDPRWMSRYRIGIATGDVCISRQRWKDGRTISHRAGGVVIINAVRIQAECAPRELWACHRTVQRLDKELQDQFSPPETIGTKAHEERGISVQKFVL